MKGEDQSAQHIFSYVVQNLAQEVGLALTVLACPEAWHPPCLGLI